MESYPVQASAGFIVIESEPIRSERERGGGFRR
jgi:hypothetical protein